MKLFLDRIEGDIAVFEDENRKTVNASTTDMIPEAVLGGVYELTGGKYHIKIDETELRKKRIQEKMKKVFKR